MTEMFGEAWSPMSVPDLAPDDDDDTIIIFKAEGIITFYSLFSSEPGLSSATLQTT